jgi:transposase
MRDLEWEFIKAVLPSKSRGVKRVDDRRVINGIFYVLRTGIPWADLPEQYGPCLIPGFDGVILSKEWKDALWDKFVTGEEPEHRVFTADAL